MKSLFSKMGDIFNKHGGGCLGCIMVLLCLALGGGILYGIFCFEGWVLMLLWNWLAVELFGATALGYWVCVGIMFAVWFIRRTVFGTKNVKVETEYD
ncbi:MAG: hypothetical protein IKU45_02020 [Clostridia bacterium]|nr:hypothetical protein [Clostridia bacterium]